MSYGSAVGVAALTPLWTNAGVFDATTNPTLAQVNTWIGQISNTLDVVLADEGFTVPVTVASAVSMLDLLVDGWVKDLVEHSRKSGRFYSKKTLDEGMSPMLVIDKEIHEWVARKAFGLRNLGVPMNTTGAGRHLASFDVLG